MLTSCLIISNLSISQDYSRIQSDGEGLFTCLDCGHSGTNLYNTRRHWEAKHGIPLVFECPHCNKQCPSKNALGSHLSRYHRGMKWFLLLITILFLKDYSQIETDGHGNYTCLDCGFTRPTLHVIKRHWDAKHGTPLIFVCPHCYKKCPSRNALTSHVSRYHRGQKWIRDL